MVHKLTPKGPDSWTAYRKMVHFISGIADRVDQSRFWAACFDPAGRSTARPGTAGLLYKSALTWSSVIADVGPTPNAREGG